MSDLNLKPIVREQTTQEKVYERLKKSILNGEITEDAIFTEVQLAELLDTSRTPVRAALQDLMNEGLVVSVPRKGLMVRKITKEEQNEILLVRVSIETEVIKKVASKIQAKHLAKLKQIIAAQEKAMLERDSVTFIALDQEFHLYFVEIAGFNLINQILLNMHNLSMLVGLKALSHQGRMKNVLLEHENLVAALEVKDPELAAERMKTHLFSTNEILNMIDHHE